jgi:hypothetical protein
MRIRPLALALLVVLAVAALVGGRELSKDAPRSEFRLSASGFGLQGLEHAAALARGRRQRSFQAVLTEGACRTFERFRVRVTARAITVWAEMREEIKPPGSRVRP